MVGVDAGKTVSDLWDFLKFKLTKQLKILISKIEKAPEKVFTCHPLNQQLHQNSTHKKCVRVDMGLKLKIVPDSWEYTGFCKFGPYWPQK